MVSTRYVLAIKGSHNPPIHCSDIGSIFIKGMRSKNQESGRTFIKGIINKNQESGRTYFKWRINKNYESGRTYFKGLLNKNHEIGRLTTGDEFLRSGRSRLYHSQSDKSKAVFIKVM